MSLNFKIIILINFIFCFALGFLSYNSLKMQRESLEKNFIKNEENTLNEVLRSANKAIMTDDYSQLSAGLELLKNLDSTLLYAAILDIRGTVIAHSDRSFIGKSSNLALRDYSLISSNYKFIVDSDLKSKNFLLNNYENKL